VKTVQWEWLGSITARKLLSLTPQRMEFPAGPIAGRTITKKPAGKLLAKPVGQVSTLPVVRNR
jgi:hypothetical protein